MIEYESRSKNSIDFHSSNYKDASVMGHKKNQFDLERGEKTEKSGFESKVRRFMEKSDIDRELEEKVKQRLK